VTLIRQAKPYFSKEVVESLTKNGFFNTPVQTVLGAYIQDHEMMLKDFGENDMTVVQYAAVIDEIKAYLSLRLIEFRGEEGRRFILDLGAFVAGKPLARVKNQRPEQLMLAYQKEINAQSR
jgi:hypothetical protein